MQENRDRELPFIGLAFLAKLAQKPQSPAWGCLPQPIPHSPDSLPTLGKS